MSELSTITIPVTVSVSETCYNVGFSEAPEIFDLPLGAAIQIIDGEHYQGDYTVTPTTYTQTLSTSGLVMEQDVTINPIPSNYGLITWNGSFLTVS